MPDVLRALPVFQWRGQAYPVARHRVSFRHEGVEHVLQYRDFALIEQLGVQGLTFSYSLPMRETVAKGPYKNLFAKGLTRLTQDMLNREPDTLVDPVFGVFRCVPGAFDSETDPNKRCGVDVSVEFRHSPDVTAEDPTLRDLGGIAGLSNEAGKLDEAVAQANWQQEPSPEPTVDALQAVDGVLSQGLAQAGRVQAALADHALKLKNIEATVEKVADPANWGIRNQARQQRASTITLGQRLGERPGQRIRAFTTRSQMLVSELAKTVGMSIEDLLALNPSLSRLPYVPANTAVVVRSVPSAA